MDYKYDDEDFKALVEERQKRTNTAEDDAIALVQICADNLSFSEDISGIRPLTDNAPQNTNLQLDNANSLRIALFEAADRDDETEWEALTKDVSKLRLTLSNEKLRRNEDKMTVLHYALENERWNVARYLLTNPTNSLLFDEYNITVENKTSRKSCLHILAEKGNQDLVRLLLGQLMVGAKKKELHKTVTQFESQRLRELNCMHLAALNGHAKLIDLFHEHGMDVNVTSNRKDTPVLFAVRGKHLETVKKLIELGADLKQENEEGLTPLYCAVRYGKVDLVKIILNGSRDKSWIIANRKRQTGFVWPIVLASAFGYHDIVDILLENGADANVRISKGQTALQIAAAESNNEVIKVLLMKGNVVVNYADNQGNTALLLAAKAGNIVAMQLLVQSGADIDCKNKVGQTIWDHAVHQPHVDVLMAVANLYGDKKDFSAGKFTFIEGINPLHAAASNGDVEKMKYLLGICEDTKARDQSGNTFFHIAARDGSDEIIKEFMSEVDVDKANNDGDTALHLACRNGHIGTIQTLLQEAKLEAKNYLGMTPLHVAVASDAVSPELVRILVERIDKTDWWQLNVVDKDGNTALHIAANQRNAKILHELDSLDPKIANHERDTPFHVAAASGINLDTMISIFYNAEKGVNIDQQNLNGESCLYVCARRGNVHSLGKLVSCGADLELGDRDGNTLIHAVIKESVEKAEKKEALLEVFRGITRVAPLWWCKKKKLKYPNEDTDEYYELLRTSMLHLTSNAYNEDDLNVVAYAIKKKAVDMLQEILNTPHVYRFMEDECYLFDITNLVPETICEDQKQTNQFVGKDSRKEMKDGSEVEKQDMDKSYLGLILELETNNTVSKILDIQPFKQLMGNPYKFFYVSLMLVHIVYMSLFSVYVFPASDELYIRYNSTTVSGCQSGGISWVYGLYLIWPGLILLYEIYFIVTFVKYIPHDEDTESYFVQGIVKLVDKIDGNDCGCPSLCLLIIIVILYILYMYLTNIESLISLAFVGLAIAWYVLLQCPSDMSTYVEIVSMVFVVGWLYTIIFTKGFEGMHSYSIMLKRIIKRDITRYLFMYIFFLLGCGLAFHALFQIVPSAGCTDSDFFHASVWITLLNVFNLMLGLGSLFDESFDECYKKYGGNPAFVRCLYVFYIICTTIILMNLLISMISDTYRTITDKEETTWKLVSLRLSFRIENSIPFIKRFRQGSHIDRDKFYFDNKTKRYMIAIPHDKIEPLKSGRVQDELLITVQRLEDKIDNLQKICAELSMRSNGIGTSSTSMIKRRPQSLFYQIRKISAFTKLNNETEI